jgi:hypothetical protein
MFFRVAALLIAARQLALNSRFAVAGGAAGPYQPGSESVLWWSDYADRVRRRPTAGMLDRCHASNTCPKIMETFGALEFWYLRESPNLVGTDAKSDIPPPATPSGSSEAGAVPVRRHGAAQLVPEFRQAHEGAIDTRQGPGRASALSADAHATACHILDRSEDVTTVREREFDLKARGDHLLGPAVNEDKVAGRTLGERGRQVRKRLVYVACKAGAAVISREAHGPKGAELVEAEKTGAGACAEDKGQFIAGLIVASDLQ